jgi:hypothetical protein
MMQESSTTYIPGANIYHPHQEESLEYTSVADRLAEAAREAAKQSTNKPLTPEPA